jgi:hypothetical protein
MADPSAWLRSSPRTGLLSDREEGDRFAVDLWSRRSIGVCLLLAAATIVTYGPLRDASFINFDDHEYVYENAHVVSGLTWENIGWAFLTTQLANWHPVTWLSHMLDCQLFGLNARAHHMVNLLLHVANTLVLFLVLMRATGTFWRSGFVAALFALHPLHVESVAWVSERKDVLSTLFWLLTVGSYLRYVRLPSVKTYFPVCFFLTLGLMTKAMLVTLPFTLLLLDYWPLCRIESAGSAATSDVSRMKLSSLVSEKVPLFALSAISCIVTFWAQRSGGAVRSLEVWPLDARIANATVAYVQYIAKLFWPVGLAIYYPHPGYPPIWKVAVCATVLVAISLLALRAARRQPALMVGWLWYLGTLIPVIGIVQIGSQAMADRYTYVPLIGLFIMLAWSIPADVTFRRSAKLAAAAAVVVIFAALSGLTWKQVRYWHDSASLFGHALDVTPENSLVHFNLALALGGEGRFAEAIAHHEATLRLDPNHREARYEIGILLEQMGKAEDAIRAYREAIRAHPDHVRARNNLAALLARAGRLEEAAFQLREALRIDPSDSKVRKNLEKILEFQDRGGASRAPARPKSD